MKTGDRGVRILNTDYIRWNGGLKIRERRCEREVLMDIPGDEGDRSRGNISKGWGGRRKGGTETIVVSARLRRGRLFGLQGTESSGRHLVVCLGDSFEVWKYGQKCVWFKGI